MNSVISVDNGVKQIRIGNSRNHLEKTKASALVLNSDEKIEAARTLSSFMDEQLRSAGVDKFFRDKVFNAEQTEFFIRQLTDIYPYLLMRKFPEIKFREYVDVVRGDPWMKRDVSQFYDVAGEAEIISQLSGDIPTVGVAGSEQIVEIKDSALAIEWQYSELQASGSYPRVEQAKMYALRRAFEQKLNGLFLYGDAVNGVNGILSDTTIPTITAAATGQGSSTRWADKTAALKLADIRDALLKVNTDSNGVFNVTKVAISLNEFNAAFADPRSDYVDTDVYQYLMTKFPMLESIEGDAYLNDKGTGGTGIMLLMDKNPENYYMRTPAEMIPLPPEYRNTKIKIPFMTRSAGLTLIQSQSVLKVNGI